MRVKRSKAMWQVAYFLSKCGDLRQPPTPLHTGSWEQAYAFFYPKLHAGRRVDTFHNSLKNARDAFDSHVGSGRIGWREDEDGRAPQPLNGVAQSILDSWGSLSDNELWNAIRPYFEPRARGASEAQLLALASEGEDEQTDTTATRCLRSF